MTTLAYHPTLSDKKFVKRKPLQSQPKMLAVQRPFDFDLARLQERVNDETVEVPQFSQTQDLLNWIKNGE
ncbi:MULTISPECIES: hypothetical protein [unclassified Moraxella]|uniref:hypothetical protein n=1 Tax=unclassified Moraxella TaxID=2685852 RepID=UPI003AF94416